MGTRYGNAIKRLFIVVLAMTMIQPAFAGNSGVTYHARIIRPDEVPLEGKEVQFRLQIRTPGLENCLLYEETQTHDLRNSGGVVTITINDSSGVRTDGGSYNFDQIFANRAAFTFPSTKCNSGTGTTTWTPNDSDGRKFHVLFREDSSRQWEPLPATQMNFVPMAIESKQIGGYGASNLLRVADGSGPAVAPVLSPTQATELVTLTNGTSALYTKAGQLNGVAIPTTYASNESIRWNGTTWVTYTTLAAADVQAFAKTSLPICGAGQVLTSDGTTLGCVNDSAGAIADATTSVKGVVAISATGGIAVSSGTISLAATGVGAGTYTKVTVDVTGRVISATTLSAADIPALDATKITTGTFAAAQIPSLDASKVTSGTFTTPGMVSGDAITSGTIGGSTGMVTSGAVSANSLSSKSIYVWDSDSTQSVQIVAPATASLTTSYVLTLPTTDGSSGEVLQTDGNGNLTWASASAGSVTNVGLTLPSIFSVSGGPVTSSGTFSATLVSQTANTVFAAPDGSAGAPSFRALASGDIPSLDAGKIATGTLAVSRIPDLDATKITTGTITNQIRNTSSVGTRSVDVYDSDSTNKVSIVTPATGSLTADYTLTLPVDDGTNGQVLTTNGSGALTWSSAAIGSVTSVDVNLPSIFTMSGGPITAAGTISATLASQAANSFWAAPNGSPGAPTFRAMVEADIPALSAAKITSGTLAAAQIPDLDAAKIATGTLAAARIPDLDAAKIATGTLAVARIPDLDAAKITTGTLANTLANTTSVATRSVQILDSDSTNKITLVTPATGSLTADYTLTFPVDDGTNGQVLTTNGSGALTWSSAAIGSVTSVDVNLPSIFTMSGGPITAAGTISATLASQAANSFWAAPNGSPGAPTFRAMVEADIPALSAAKITSGTFAAAQIPDLDAAKIATGTLAAGRIPDLDAAKIATGTLNVARIPDLDAAKVATGTLNIARIPDLDAAKITTGTLANTLANTTSVATRSVQILDSDSTNKITLVTPATGSLTADYTLTLPVDDGTNGQVLTTNGSGALTWSSAAIGSVTSVDVNLPSIFTMSGGPITAAGTISATLASQAQNTFWAAPNGSAGAPTFRVMVEADVPALSAGKITSGTFAAAQIPNLDGSKVNSGTVTAAVDNTSLVGTRTIRVYDSDSTNSISIVTPATGNLTSNYVLTLPTDDGAANQVLQTDGSGALTWVNMTSTSSGTFRADNGSATVPTHSFSSDTDNGMFLPATDNLGFSTQGTERIRVLANGNVGIGMNNPSHALAVAGNVSGYNFYSGNGTASGVNFGSSGAGMYVPASNILGLSTNSTARLLIDETGNIGVGTTTPGTKLDIAGVITANVQGTGANQGGELRFQELVANGANYAAFRVPDALAANYVLTLPADDGTANQVLQTDGSGVLTWVNQTSTASGTFRADNGTAAIPTHSFTSDTNTGMYSIVDDVLGFSTGGTNRLSVDANGYVGIGTTAPAHRLSIVDNANGGGGGHVAIKNSFNGASARAAFQAEADSNGVTTIMGHTSSSYSNGSAPALGADSGFLMSSGTTGLRLAATANAGASHIGFWTHDGTSVAERMRIKRDGSLGIGTSNPGTKLDVAGVITANVQGTGANQGGELRFQELAANGANYAAFRVPDALAANYVLTLPVDDGTANQVLQTDGSGVLTWVNMTSTSSGTFRADNGTATIPTHSFTSDTNTGMYLNTADVLGFTTNGTARLTIDSAGNIGIGTTAPGLALDVNGGSRSNGHVITNGAQLYPSANGLSINLTAGGDFHVANSGATPLMTVKQGGSVGVGTTTPGTKLDVAGVITANVQGTGANQGGELRFQELAANGANYAAFRVPDALAANYVLTLPVDDGTANQVLQTDGNGVLSWTTPSSTSSGTFRADNGSATIPTHSFTSDTNTGMYLNTADVLGFTSNGTARMTIDSAGRVGIGLTNPTATFQVDGNMKISQAIESTTIATNSLLLDNNQVDAGGVRLNAAGSLNFNVDADNDGVGAFNFRKGSTNPAGATPLMTITNGGNVGVGLSDPQYPLHVLKSGYSQLRFESTNDSTELDMAAYGAGKQSMLFLTAARGTRTAPTYLQSGDNIGYLGASAAQGGSQAARIMFNATAAWSGTSTPGNIVFATTPPNSTVPLDRMELKDTGVLEIGATPSTTPLLQVNSAIRLNPQGTAANQAGEIRFQELAANGANYAALRVPDALAANYVLTLPVDDGTANQVLQTDGNGVLSWTTVSAGSSGTFLANNGSATIPTHSFTSDTNTGMYLNTADVLGFTTNGTARVTIGSTGYVGIGTTAPTAPLHVVANGNADNNITLSNNTTGNAAAMGIYFTGETAGNQLGWLGYNSSGTSDPAFSGRLALSTTASNTNGLSLQTGHSSADIRFYTNGSNERMRINSAGNIGIGTTNPGALLTVGGSYSPADTDVLQLGTSYTGAATNLAIKWGPTNTRIQNLYTSYTGGFYSGLQFKTDNNGVSTTAMSIVGNGNVGIGTTTPATKLDVAGVITASPQGTGANQAGEMRFGELVANGSHSAALRVPDALAASYVLTLPVDDGTANQVLQTDGNGVLTWVNQTSTSSGTYRANDGTAAIPTFSFASDTNTGMYLNTADTLGFTTGGTARMTVDSSGRVGIGTTAPNAALSVVRNNPGGNIATLQNTAINGWTSFDMYDDGSNLKFGFGYANTGAAAWGGSAYFDVQGTTPFLIAQGTVRKIEVNSSGNVLLNPTSGNVGIGNTNPMAPLWVHLNPDKNIGFKLNNGESSIVAGNDASNAWAPLLLDGSVLALQTVTAGNVGIGTTAPATTLHVSGGNANGIIVERPAALSSSIQYKNTVGSMYAGIATNGNFGISTGSNLNAAPFVMTPAGNVGIGTTGPTGKLSIADNVVGNLQFDIKNASTDPSSISTIHSTAGNYYNEWRAYGSGFSQIQTNALMLDIKNQTGYIVMQTAATERLRIDTSGKVGIGTTSPTAKLHVAGAIASNETVTAVAAGATHPSSGGVDMSVGNVFTFSTGVAGACPTIKLDFNTMVTGGAYTVVLSGYNTGTCTFTDAAGATTAFRYYGGAAPTLSGAGDVVCTMTRANSRIYTSCLNF